MRIGELAREAGVGVETVRFYEREGLLQEPSRNALHRLRQVLEQRQGRTRRSCPAPPALRAPVFLGAVKKI